MTNDGSKFGPLIGAIDEGTSSARFIIFRRGTADVVAIHQQELSQLYPQEGWVEQNPLDIISIVLKCISGAIEKLESIGGSRKDIVAVGVTNQRETTIVWDKYTGQPLYNALVWCDMRTSKTVDDLLETIPNKTRNKDYLKPLCGLPLSPYFSALKIKWLIDNVPEVRMAIDEDRCLFGTVDSWLIWNLTGGLEGGVHVTDVTNASRTMLMNLETLKYDPTLINFFGIKDNILPTIKSSAEVYGIFKSGPLSGVPISGCVGDQQSALLGQQCLAKGQAKATYGTGCFLLYNTGHEPVHSVHGLLTTVAYQLGSSRPPVYALEGSVAVAGAALSWLKNNISILPSISETQTMAETVTDCGDVYFVPAFSGLYAPYWNQGARGVICGINEDTKSAHIVRAALEAVCFQVRDILDAMNQDCGDVLTNLQVDGGMSSNSLLMQIQSDLIGLEVLRPSILETTALGAAMAAGYGVGEWNFDKETFDIPRQIFKPIIKENERNDRYSKWKMAVERSIDWDV